MMEESRRLRSSLSFNKLNSLSSGSLGKDTTVHLLRAGERRRLTTAISVKKSEQLAQAALLDEERNKKRIEKLRTFAGLDRPGHVDQEGLQKFVKQEDEAAHMEELRIKMRSRSMKVKGSASMKRLLANLPAGTALENMWGVDDISSEEREQQWAMEVEQQVQSERTTESLQRTQHLQDVRKQGVSEAASPPKRRLTSTGVPVSSLVPDLTPAEVQALRPQQDTSPRHEPPVKPALKQPITSLEERLRRRSRAARMSFQVIPTVSLEQQAVSVSEPEVAEVEGRPEEPSLLMQHQPEPAKPEEEEHARPPSAEDEIQIQESLPIPAVSVATMPAPTRTPVNRKAYRDRLAESVQKHLERTSRRTGMISRSTASKPSVETEHLEPQESGAGPAAKLFSETTARVRMHDQVWLATQPMTVVPMRSFSQPSTATPSSLATSSTGGSLANGNDMQLMKPLFTYQNDSKHFEAHESRMASPPQLSQEDATLVPCPHQVKHLSRRGKELSINPQAYSHETAHTTRPIGSPATSLASSVLSAQYPSIDSASTPSTPSYHRNREVSLIRQSLSAFTSRHIPQRLSPSRSPSHTVMQSAAMMQKHGSLVIQKNTDSSTLEAFRSKWAVTGRQLVSQASRVSADIEDKLVDSMSAPTSRSSSPFTSRTYQMRVVPGRYCFLSDSDRQRMPGEQKVTTAMSPVEATRTFTNFPQLCRTPTTGSEHH
mmetsp:Transcript_22276/g.42504  ORF Transcript_22276/g.42504 Transcript_22276/m.42504 type:complete len:715 (-) Transcript_22276:47-2191(-)